MEATLPPAALSRHDIQGLVVSGYGKNMLAARYLLLGVVDPPAARRWVGELADRVTTSEGPEARRCTNVAFTAAGLAALGLEPGELASFSTPFREGMTSEHRQRLLGDVEASHPGTWAWGGPEGEQVDVGLLLFAKDEATMEEVEAEERAALTAGGLQVVVRLTPETGSFGTEHFGFADGLSQPVIRGSGQDEELAGDDARRSVIEAGEFVLGYRNGYQQLTPWPRLRAPGEEGRTFGCNGTYLVLRQLAQDVALFWSFLRDATGGAAGAPDDEEMERLAAHLIGRWPSGAPLVRAAHRDDPALRADNSFGYAATDPFGHRCPIGAHIRRSNPRDSLEANPGKALELANLHRILRRSRRYGPPLADRLGGDDGRERGLYFLCVNASIDRQFEFVQHSWCNNTKLGGLYDEQDPLLGNEPADGKAFTLQGAPLRQRVRGIPNVVTVRGGAYFFLPGVKALRTLAALDR